MGDLIYMILIGLAAGALAKYLSPGDEPGNFNDVQGLVITAIIGIVGSLIGGFVGKIIGLGAYGFIGKIILATIGALIFLSIYKKYKAE